MNKFAITLLVSFVVSCSTFTNNKLEISKVEVPTNKFFFKYVKYQDTIRHKFLIKNISQNPLIIDEVGSSCGCIVTKFSKNPILKNGFAEVDITFTPTINQTGIIRKTILVKCNTDDIYLPFYIEGLVIGEND